MFDTSITIIGAGVVGLAIAAELSKAQENIFVLEKHSKFGQETSSRNSEVIHSGIYYPTNSLKASLCVAGNKMLYDFCNVNEINYLKCGKLVVAINSEEEAVLQQILKQSIINGVTDGQLISKEEVKKIEPEIFSQKPFIFHQVG
jgi:L-2-hydroxyglutarate oxidase LhgO